MKIRSTHVILLFLFGLGVVVALVFAGGRERPAIQDEDDFLATVRESGTEQSQTDAGQVGALPGQGQENAGVPLLVPETTDFDLGIIPNNEVTTRDMMLHNRGTAQLELTDIKTTCGCTVGVVDSRFIPAGESIAMHVAVTPFKIPGFHSVKTLTIYSNDPANPTVTVDVTAEVDPEFLMTPKDINFGEVPQKDGGQLVVDIRQVDDLESPLEISNLQVLPPQAGIEGMLQLVPEEEWQQPGMPEYRIVLAVLPTAPVGPISATLMFRHNIKRLPEMHLPISGEVVGFYRIATHLERSSTLEPGAMAEGVYEISADAPIEVLSTETDAAGLSVAVRQGETPQQVLFDVQVAPEAEPGIYRGLFTVSFKSGENQAVERLPLQVAVRRTPQKAPEVRLLNSGPSGATAAQEQ
jgi:hypothetical protein